MLSRESRQYLAIEENITDTLVIFYITFVQFKIKTTWFVQNFPPNFDFFIMFPKGPVENETSLRLSKLYKVWQEILNFPSFK